MSIVARFDSWISLSYTNIVNNVGSFEISLSGDDPRKDLFELDAVLRIYRSIPGLGVGWTRVFDGLFRSKNEVVNADGSKVFVASGLGLLDFLSRTIINYPAGTIKSYKNIAAETAIKEYVEENCGPTAITDVGYERLRSGVLPSFSVEITSSHGDIWEGDRAFENLLDIVNEIAGLNQIDFDVEFDSDSKSFEFKTFLYQLGSDRTVIGLNSSTGLNVSGNVPVVFSVERGNVSSLEYKNDRTSEANVVAVLGSGTSSTRIVVVREEATVSDSPWNRREISRSQTGFISEMEMAGDQILFDSRAVENIDFSPLQQESCMYVKDFFLGDKVTVRYGSMTFNKRIIQISDQVSPDGSIEITFSE
jgi:hypothetical protein